MSTANLAQAPRIKTRNAMAKLFHPGLLWKEWRQHRYLWILFFSLIMLQPVFVPLFIRVFALPNRIIAESGLSPSAWVLKAIIQNGACFMEQTAVIAVVLLATIMLGAERGSSLNYLASTAVSRRQILAAKWLLGNLGILVCMSALLLYMVAISTINSGIIPLSLLLLWSVRTTLVLLALFSLALLSACIFSSILYSAVFTGFFLMLPVLLTSIIVFPLTKFHVLTVAQASQVNQWLNYLNIIEYISADGAAGLNNTGYLLGSMFVLLLADLLFLLMAMRLFDRNPLERSGEVFLSGNSKEKGRLGLAIFLSPLLACNMADSWPQFLICLLLLFIAIYLGMGILWRLSAGLGLAKN